MKNLFNAFFWQFTNDLSVYKSFTRKVFLKKILVIKKQKINNKKKKKAKYTMKIETLSQSMKKKDKGQEISMKAKYLAQILTKIPITSMSVQCI